MKIELTKKEKEYILNELISTISSVYFHGSYKNKNELTLSELLEAPESCFDIKEWEVKIVKGILSKLKE